MYLTSIFILVSPIKEKSLVLYLTTLDHYLRELLAQGNAKGKGNALLPQSNNCRPRGKVFPYSKCMLGAEIRYPEDATTSITSILGLSPKQIPSNTS